MVCLADENYEQASFNGFGFSIYKFNDEIGEGQTDSEFDSSTISVGRRGVLHEFPYYDIPFYEDMGRKARRYDITGVFQGDDHADQGLKFINMIETTRTGILVHPQYGEDRVVALEVKLTNSVQQIGVTTVNMTFIEAGEYTQPVSAFGNLSRIFDDIRSELPGLDKALNILRGLDIPENNFNPTAQDIFNVLQIAQIQNSSNGSIQAGTLNSNVLDAPLTLARLARGIKDNPDLFLDFTRIDQIADDIGIGSIEMLQIVSRELFEQVDRNLGSLTYADSLAQREGFIRFVDAFNPTTNNEILIQQNIRRNAQNVFNNLIAQSPVESVYYSNGTQTLPQAFQAGFGLNASEIDRIEFLGTDPMSPIAVFSTGPSSRAGFRNTAIVPIQELNNFNNGNIVYDDPWEYPIGGTAGVFFGN